MTLTDQEIQDQINAQSEATERTQVQILIDQKEAEIEELRTRLSAEATQPPGKPDSAPEPESQLTDAELVQELGLSEPEPVVEPEPSPEPVVEAEAETKVEVKAEKPKRHRRKAS